MRYLKPPKRRNTLKVLVIWALLMVPASVLLYGTSAEVRAQETELAAVKDNIAREKEALRVLNAEWAYLNDPQRLALRAQRYLKLAQAASPEQVASFNDLEVKLAMRETDMQFARQDDLPGTRLLAQPIAHHHELLVSLHSKRPERLPSAASWSHKVVSALSLGVELPLPFRPAP